MKSTKLEDQEPANSLKIQYEFCILHLYLHMMKFQTHS